MDIQISEERLLSEIGVSHFTAKDLSLKVGIPENSVQKTLDYLARKNKVIVKTTSDGIVYHRRTKGPYKKDATAKIFSVLKGPQNPLTAVEVTKLIGREASGTLTFLYQQGKIDRKGRPYGYFLPTKKVITGNTLPVKETPTVSKTSLTSLKNKMVRKKAILEGMVADIDSFVNKLNDL